MRKLLLAALILCPLSAPASYAQVTRPARPRLVSTKPNGSCSEGDFIQALDTHKTSLCQNGAWVDIATGAGAVSALDDLSDVTLTAPGLGKYLRHDGTSWVDGVIQASDVPALDAAKVTSGVFAGGRLWNVITDSQRSGLTCTAPSYYYTSDTHRRWFCSQSNTLVEDLEPGDSIDLSTGYLAVEVPNDTTTGTTVNTLAKLSASGKAIITTAGDTEGALGVVVAGAGTSGSAVIAVQGQIGCVADNAVAVGDYIGIGSATNGRCKSLGSAYPTAGGVLVGRALSAQGSAGSTFTMRAGAYPKATSGSGVADPGSNGLMARTALNTTAARSLSTTAAAAGQLAPLTVTNGDGVSGNPTVDVSAAPSGAYVPFPRDFTGDSTVASALAAANTVYAKALYVPVKITVNSIVHRLDSSSVAGGHYALAIYSYDRNTKLVDTGALDANVAAGYFATSVTATTLLPGYYWVAWTGDSTSIQLRGYAAASTPATIFFTGTAQMGTAANASVAGAMPSTLGAITGVSLAVPIIKIQN